MRTAINMNLLLRALARIPHAITSFCNGYYAVISDRNFFGSTGKLINHRKNRIRRCSKRQRILTSNDVEIQRRKLLIADQVLKLRARARINDTIAITCLAILDENRHVSAHTQPL